MKKIKKLFLRVTLVVMLGMMSVATLPSLVSAQGGFGSQDTNYNPTVPGSTAIQNDSLINVLKNFINRVLGILALIALVVLLWGGFQMVTAAGNDDRYKTGFKILKQSSIGLAFIALAWLFISLIFWLIGIITVTG